MGAIFFSPGDSHIERLLVLLHLGLEGVTDVDTDSKGRFVYFKFTPYNDRVFCFYGHSTRKQLSRGHSLKELQNHMKNKNEGNKNKILADFNCTMDKMERNSRNKTLYVISIMPCQNSSWIVDWKIYGEGRIQISLSSPATIDPPAQDL